MKKNKINIFSELLESILEETGNIRKGIRINTTGPTSTIRDKFIKIKKTTEQVNLESEDLFLNLNKDENNLVLPQKKK